MKRILSRRTMRRLQIRAQLAGLQRDINRLEVKMIEASQKRRPSSQVAQAPEVTGAPVVKRRQSPRARRQRAAILGLAAVSLLAGLTLVGRSTYIETKRHVARQMIATALHENLLTGAAQTPWPWADFHPVARLHVPRLDESTPVLSGSTGSSLAFGLGLIDGTGTPESGGNLSIAGHRDREFSWLDSLVTGDEVRLESHGAERAYWVESRQVVSDEDTQWIEPMWEDRLTLITCYPLDALTETHQRLVVRCRPAGIGIWEEQDETKDLSEL